MIPLLNDLLYDKATFAMFMFLWVPFAVMCSALWALRPWKDKR